VSSIALRNLLSHRDTELDLPPTGVVVVTGDNGAGKSSFVECVAVACWGKTLRGAPAWREGEVSEAWCAANDLSITRTKKRGSPSLEWEDPVHAGDAPGARSAEYPTTTKAQEALETIIGSFDAWRRSHVFSSSDAAHFTLATDAERKRLLEALFVPGSFDPALAACRADLKDASKGLTSAGANLARLRGDLGGAQQRLADARAALETLGTEPEVDGVTPADLASLTSQVTAIDKDIAGTRRELAAINVTSGGLGAKLEAVTKQAAVVEKDTCPTCGQAIDPETRQHVRDQVEAVDVELTAAKKQAAQERTALEATLAELVEERGEFQADLDEQRTSQARAAAAARTARMWQGQHDHQTQVIADAGKRVAELQPKVQEAEATVAAGEAEVRLLKAVEIVLGLKGARVGVLSKALTGLEAVANVWLSKLGRADMVLRCRSYKANKTTGGGADAISLEIEGAGGGYGYKAASGGERRRLDVALLLALAEVAAGGIAKGTLWFDEVFDCLDGGGTEAVARALVALGRDRCVVVITHADALVQALPSALRVRVVDGELVGLG
jgi:DNA repair exonuclease SbcCD ATPase subunit